MAAHVVVIDSTARSIKIKTTPGKHLTDILEEACTKFGRDANLYGLKHKSKVLDLSRTVMLSGLLPGAKLELVAASRSPSVVSVALQLPQAETNGTARLTEKFPSNTTLWLILRKFEAQQSSKRNFTARSTPLNAEQTSGSGRLFYETPVITALSRELSSFTDLQKSLAQLGVNGGSILLRLNFRETDTPLEDAMSEIEQYFKESAKTEDVEIWTEGAEDTGTNSTSQNQASVIKTNQTDPLVEVNRTAQEQSVLSDAKPVGSSALSDGTNIPNSAIAIETVTGPSDRPIAVFAPPTSPVPKAASQKENDADFEPTLDHVRSHQRYLQDNSRNKTLKSDAELAAEADTKAQRTAQIKEVEIKLRFPDQSQVSASFSNLDTARTLYEHAQGLMRSSKEPISLSFAGAKGRQTVPCDSEIKLISGLGLVGRVLVEVSWGDAASIEARTGPTLKDEYRAKAQEIPVRVIKAVDMEHAKEPVTVEGKEKEREGKKGGMPKWFKGIGK